VGGEQTERGGGAKMAQLKVTQVRSLSGSTERQRLTLKGLGLRKRHHEVVVEDTPAIRGMISKVSHLVEVEEVEE
jgi:large subunit ribosomal protein L30